eukprot:s755_g7.t1
MLWVAASSHRSDILGYASGIMSEGSLVAYECCDSKGKPPENYEKRVPEPGRPPGPPGGAAGPHPMGLDNEVAALGTDVEAEVEKAAKEAGRGDGVASPKGSVGGMPEKKAAERRAARAAEEVERRRRQEERGQRWCRPWRRRGRLSGRGERGERSGSSESSCSFSPALYRGEGGNLGAVSREPRIPAEARGERARKLHGRAQSRGRSSRRVDVPQDGGVPHPSGSRPASPTSHWGSKSRGVAGPAEGDRLCERGKSPRIGGCADEKIEDPGKTPPGPGVALRKTPGVDSTAGLKPRDGGGETTDRSGRAASSQVARDAAERHETRGVGTRRQCQATTECRDASPKQLASGNRGGVNRGDRPQRKREGEDAPPSEVEHERERRTKRRRKRKGESGGGEEGRKPTSPEALTDAGSLGTVMPEEDGLGCLEVLLSWLQSEETAGLSIAQSVVLLALVLRGSGTPLGTCVHRVVVPGSDDGLEGRRQRGILPLPLFPDAKTEIEKVFSSGGFEGLAGTRGTKERNKEKAARQLRWGGSLIWGGSGVTSLKFLSTGGNYEGRSPLIELCEGKLREKLLNLMVSVLPGKELPEDPPMPLAHASWEQAGPIAKGLCNQGWVEPVEEKL